ncbi:hypothetical protein PBI_ROPE_75 [Mycobacterium phage Rope]|uniref:Uncharacterized protein n=1 Tax=Mycobacterium phage Rope TaxID=2767563 RepID=A0A7G9V0C9_9CAUD|nr:hypothetical protein PBI_ROPE_75 [Mycobacterium phage Rope]
MTYRSEAVDKAFQKALETLRGWENVHSAVVDFGLGDSASRELPHHKVVTDNVPLDDGANAIGSYVVGTAPVHEIVHPFDDRIRGARIYKSEGKHRVLLDLDCPHVYVPSSTPGHGHLIIDVPQDWNTYKRLLQLLGDMGILQYGYVDASFKREETWLRAPGVPKSQGGMGL